MGERFYAPEPPHGGRLRLSSNEAHHLSRVLRLGSGAEVECFDGLGSAWKARVGAVAKDAVDLEIVAELPRPAHPPIRLTLATAIPKGDRVDWLIEKATEIGVDRLVPLRTARSVVDPSPSKLERLRQRVIEACKQSGRNTLMRLENPVEWGRFLEVERLENRLGWIACPGAESLGMGQSPPTQSVTLAIGPEGGFDPSEIEGAFSRGWRPIGLGPYILRVETAGLAGAVVLLDGCYNGVSNAARRGNPN
ncbi:MAG: RsmE family RNA methyltransferase [Isosphaeraceae bacterium]